MKEPSQTKSGRMQTVLYTGIYVLSMLIFGTNGLLVSHISIQPKQIVLMRTLIGGLVLTALVLLRGGFPGGAPVFLNKYMRGGTERYPLNQFSAMLVNVVIAYLCYLLPVFLPEIVWLGLAPVLFGCVFQVMLHLMVFLIKFHHFYNSGLAAVLCIHVPCGILYIRYAASQGLLAGRTWLYTVLYLIGMILFTVLFGQKLFSRKDSPYPFDKKEVEAGEQFAKRMGINR